MTVRDRTARKLQVMRDTIEKVESHFRQANEAIPHGIEMSLDSLRNFEQQLVDELAEMDRNTAPRRSRSVAAAR